MSKMPRRATTFGNASCTAGLAAVQRAGPLLHARNNRSSLLLIKVAGAHRIFSSFDLTYGVGHSFILPEKWNTEIYVTQMTSASDT